MLFPPGAESIRNLALFLLCLEWVPSYTSA